MEFPNTENERNSLNDALLGGIKDAIKQAAEEEITKAKEHIEDRVHEIISQLVMNIHNYFEVRNYGNRIVIEVRKDI